jgi:hypothetical protein
MLDAFASVGARTCDLTITTRYGGKENFQQAVPVDRLRSGIAAILDKAAEAEHNVIVRPRGPGVGFVQLDDLNAIAAQRVRDVAFLGLRTSPGNHQAWVAIPPADSARGDLARSLRKTVGADLAASGATRIAGSLNFKDKYAPDFPRVELIFNMPRLTASKEKLARLGLIALGDPPRGQPATAAHFAYNESPRGSGGYPSRIAAKRPAGRKWPSYARCVEGAPEARAGGRPDISRADFTWCMIAIDWGWSVEETAARLMEQSPKARENGQRYALVTAQHAAAAVTVSVEKRTSPRPCFFVAPPRAGCA